jgi:hypothetical protein
MRRELLEQVMTEVFGRRLGLADVEDALRSVVTDPILVEKHVGRLYGIAFKKLEERYDAAHAGSRLAHRRGCEGR